MDRKLSRLLESGLSIAFVCLFIFAGVTAALGHYAVAGAELFVVLLVYFFYKRRTNKRANDIRKFVENLA
ncbi:MAG: hypothetical protein IJS65_02570, partial [Clostridia bacterium]|nr:hypothetical protein [Clostridia bacterium]